MQVKKFESNHLSNATKQAQRNNKKQDAKIANDFFITKFNIFNTYSF